MLEFKVIEELEPNNEILKDFQKKRLENMIDNKHKIKKNKYSEKAL